MQDKDIAALRKVGNLVRNYVNNEGDFKFIDYTDVRLAFSSNNKVVCLIKKDNIASAIPKDMFQQWFDNMSDNIFAAYDYDTNVRLVNDCIAFNAVSTEKFVKMKNDNVFLEDVGAFIASVLEVIDGAVIDDWGENLDEEDEGPYFGD